MLRDRFIVIIILYTRSLKRQNLSMEATSTIHINGNKDSGTFVKGVLPGRWSMALQRGPGRNPATAKRYKPMNVGCWNVRTLLDDKVNV